MSRIWEMILKVVDALAPARPEARKVYERKDPAQRLASKTDHKRPERSGWEKGQLNKVRPKGKAGY